MWRLRQQRRRVDVGAGYSVLLLLLSGRAEVVAVGVPPMRDSVVSRGHAELFPRCNAQRCYRWAWNGRDYCQAAGHSNYLCRRRRVLHPVGIGRTADPRAFLVD